MEVGLDSNVLFRTLISAGDIVRLLFDKDLEVLAPERLREEFLQNKKEILAKSYLSEEDFHELVSLLFNRITFIPLQEYKEFLPEARRLLGNHLKDEDFIALCLMKKIKL